MHDSDLRAPAGRNFARYQVKVTVPAGADVLHVVSTRHTTCAAPSGILPYKNHYGLMHIRCQYDLKKKFSRGSFTFKKVQAHEPYRSNSTRLYEPFTLMQGSEGKNMKCTGAIVRQRNHME